jgi:hypothetical protein
MSDKGLYIPGKDGRFEFRGVKENETRQILTYEHDSGRILLNFNAVFQQYGRKLQDIVTITEGGVVMGLILTSSAVGPQERAAAEKSQEKPSA